MTPTVYHLVGAPGSGKRTVGLHLERLTGAVLLDNHLFRDAIYKPYGADGLRPIPDKIQALGTQVQLLGLEAAKLAPPDVSQIFTSYLSAQDSGQQALGLMRDLAAVRGAHYVPVWLECPAEELERRMTLPERQQRAKMRDPARLRELLAERGTMPPPAAAMRVNTSALSPADTALLIATHAGALF